MNRLLIVISLLLSSSAYSYNCNSNCEKTAIIKVPCPTFGNWGRKCNERDPIRYTACVTAKAADCTARKTKKIISDLTDEKNDLLKHYSKALSVNNVVKKKNKALKSSEKKLKASTRNINRSIKNKDVSILDLKKGLDSNIAQIRSVVSKKVTKMSDVGSDIDLSRLPSHLSKAITDTGNTFSDAAKAIHKSPLGKGLDKNFVKARDALNDAYIDARDFIFGSLAAEDFKCGDKTSTPHEIKKANRCLEEDISALDDQSIKLRDQLTKTKSDLLLEADRLGISVIKGIELSQDDYSMDFDEPSVITPGESQAAGHDKGSCAGAGCGSGSGDDESEDGSNYGDSIGDVKGEGSGFTSEEVEQIKTDYVSLKQKKAELERTVKIQKSSVKATNNAKDLMEASVSRQDRELALTIGLGIIDVGLSLTPGVSWGKDIYEGFTGLNVVTGDELDRFDRTFAIAGMFSFGALSKFKFSRRVFTKLNKFMKMDSGDYRNVVKLVGDGRSPGVFDSAKKVGVKANEGFKDLMEWLGKPFPENREFGAIIIGKYKPPPKFPKAFDYLTITKRKTPSAGGGLRKRWKDNKGNIYEWDSQHGAIEKYNKNGKHLGEFDPNTGVQTKPANPSRTVEK